MDAELTPLVLLAAIDIFTLRTCIGIFDAIAQLVPMSMLLHDLESNMASPLERKICRCSNRRLKVFRSL